TASTSGSSRSASYVPYARSISHVLAYSSARAWSRLATATRSTFSDACAPGITFRFRSAVDTMPSLIATSCLHSSDGRVQRPIASVSVCVDARPGWVRLHRLAHADARGHGVRGVRERPAHDSGEKRCAVGRALVDDAALERQAEYGRDDLEPHTAPRTPPGCAPRRPGGAARAQETHRVAR